MAGPDSGRCRLQPLADRLDRRDARACGCAPTGRGSGAAGARGSRSACRSPPGPASRQSTAWISTSASTSSSPMRRRSLGAVERGRHRARDDVALDALHDVERRADDGRVVAHREHLRARARGPASARSTRASRRTSCALGGSGAARRAAQRRRRRRRGAARRSRWSGRRRPASTRASPAPRPCASRKAAQRLEHEQRLALVGRGLGVGADDVVRGDCGAHRTKP